MQPEEQQVTSGNARRFPNSSSLASSSAGGSRLISSKSISEDMVVGNLRTGRLRAMLTGCERASGGTKFLHLSGWSYKSKSCTFRV